jgi:hypothetical protein
MADNSSGGSATTVLITVIIVVIIGAALYFGFVRGSTEDNNPSEINVELNTPDLNSDNSDNGTNY